MLSMFALALLGGVILNVMPCVLPVLALKAFHLFDKAGQSSRTLRMHGIAYMLGTMSLMVGLATVALVAKLALGRNVHWGSQFQSPYFVATMVAIVFAFALNALGVFEITLSVDDGGKERDGLSGSFTNGLFAAIMATPCSAPFLGTAVAFALASDTPAWQTEVVFALIGVGLALPYVILTFVPALSQRLPRPGAWMETFKQLMGFTLVATAVWLFRSLQMQVSQASASAFLFFLVMLALALWAGGRFGGAAVSAQRRWVVRAGQLALVASMGFYLVKFEPADGVACAETPSAETADVVVHEGHIRWTPYSAARVSQEHARQRPVFVDFTATWCTSCKFNDAAFIETDLVRGAFVKTGILPMQVDMTGDNPEGDALMTRFNRDGIPIYVILMPDGSYDLLPQVITAEMVSERLAQASQRFPLEKFTRL